LTTKLLSHFLDNDYNILSNDNRKSFDIVLLNSSFCVDTIYTRVGFPNSLKTFSRVSKMNTKTYTIRVARLTDYGTYKVATIAPRTIQIRGVRITGSHYGDCSGLVSIHHMCGNKAIGARQLAIGKSVIIGSGATCVRVDYIQDTPLTSVVKVTCQKVKSVKASSTMAARYPNRQNAKLLKLV
jgi:hypothetical protein